MSAFRTLLKHFSISVLLALGVSGQSFAATFTLTDEAKLSNISAMRTQDELRAQQVRYSLSQPQFFKPIVSFDEFENTETPSKRIDLWTSSEFKVSYNTRPSVEGLADGNENRVRWYEKAIPSFEYNFPKVDDPFLPVADLMWPGKQNNTSHEQERPKTLYAFLVRDIDTTCGFPNDLLTFFDDENSQIGRQWLYTASLPGREAGNAYSSNTQTMNWFEMPMPIVDSFPPVYGPSDHATPSTTLQYPNVDRRALSMISGFYKPKEIFRCRVFASATRPTLPNYQAPRLFAANANNVNAIPFPIIPATIPTPGAGSLMLACMGAFWFGRRKTLSRKNS